jgi:hypothetical protein
MNDAGGWIWLVIDVGFVAVFAAVLAYGTIWYRRRRAVGCCGAGIAEQKITEWE